MQEQYKSYSTVFKAREIAILKLLKKPSRTENRISNALPVLSEADHMPCMYDFGYHTLDKGARGQIETIVSKQQALIQAGQYQEAVSYFRNATPITMAPHHNDEYYKLVSQYQLAMALAFLGRYAEASICMNQTGIMSAGDRQDLLFSEHQQFALYLRKKQQEAIHAGRPGIMITSLPKSASAFLSHAIAEILDVPVLRASIGEFPHHTVVKNWAVNIAEGGCVTHDHFAGMDVNIDQLVQAGIKKVYVQLRDPRPTALSYLHHTTLSYKQRGETVTLEDIINTQFYPHALAWIESWMNARDKFKNDIDIEFLLFDDVVNDTQQILTRILPEQYNQQILDYIEKSASSDFKPTNFRKGKSDEWRKHFSKALQETVWEQTPQPVKDLLKMER